MSSTMGISGNPDISESRVKEWDRSIPPCLSTEKKDEEKENQQQNQDRSIDRKQIQESQKSSSKLELSNSMI